MEAAEPARAADPFDPEVDPFAPQSSTLIVERVGAPQGIAVGAGEAKRLSVGRVFPFRGAKPAIRLVAGSGPLLLAFDEETDRDRAATELAAESGMTRQGDGTATLPLSG